MTATSLLVLWCLALLQSCGSSSTPLETLPLASVYPCKDSTDIKVWLETRLPRNHTSRYYAHFSRMIPAHSVVNVTFDSPVDVTFALPSDWGQYSRVFFNDGESFELRVDHETPGLSLLVEGTTPGPVPYLTGLSINDQQYCDDPNKKYLQNFKTNNTEPKDVQHELDAVTPNSKIDNTRCGKPIVDNTRSLENGPAQPGAWPWHAAIYLFRKKPAGFFYTCGGTLVSKNFVLTAAHCASVKGKALSPERFNVELGKYHLDKVEKQSESMKVDTVIIHEKFNHTYFDTDIALLKLRLAPSFTDYIQPACLWPRGAYSALEDDKTVGVVAGWGYGNDNTQPSELQQVQLPIVSLLTCILSYPNHYARYLFPDSFCAGYHNKGTSVCNGDAGGALMVFLPHEKQTNDGTISGSWHVRGVLSNSLAVRDQPYCDPDQYSIFIDMNKFRDWMEQHLEG